MTYVEAVDKMNRDFPNDTWNSKIEAINNGFVVTISAGFSATNDDRRPIVREGFHQDNHRRAFVQAVETFRVRE